jgi:preprotein translocase subunit SecA
VNYRTLTELNCALHARVLLKRDVDYIVRDGRIRLVVAGAVTISTNMAGRGTDIRLGGADEAARQRVVEGGGLYVIGTNRHESRRVDLQLRGRAGRQGDPGESRFFVSLDDDLLVRHGLRRLIPARLLPDPRHEPIESTVVTREIARAQRIIEGQNLEIRRTLRRYATPVEEQRRILHRRRRDVLLGREPLGLWHGQPRWRELTAAAGAQALERAERAITLFEIDRAWSDRIGEAFGRLEEAIDAGVVAALHRLAAGPKGLELEALGLQRPTSTWTYLVNDDPFRDLLGMSLTGPGKTTFAIGAAISARPLLVLLGLADRFLKKRPARYNETR